MTIRPRRSGFSLIEMLVVITVLTVMCGLSAGLIHVLFKLDRAGRIAGEVAADLGRLAHDFRIDVHSARSNDPTGQPAIGVKLATSGDRTVEYWVRSADIVRTVRDGDKVRHHDLYRRPAKSTVHFETTLDGSRPFLSLVIDRPPNGTDDSLYRDFRIEAEMGKDQRLTSRAP